MTLEADLVSLLLGDAAIVAAINDVQANERRIYPLERPQGQQNLRAIVYTPIFSEPAANLENGAGAGAAGGLENCRLQIDIWAAKFDQARELAALVNARMNTGSASIRAVRISQRSDLDPDTRERREVLEYSVWHSPQ